MNRYGWLVFVAYFAICAIGVNPGAGWLAVLASLCAFNAGRAPR